LLAEPDGAAQISHRTAPRLLEQVPEKSSTRAKVAHALAVAREDRHRLQVLQSVLTAGPREWWALPLILASHCTGRTWEDDTLVKFAVHLHTALAKASTAEARVRITNAVRPHPMMASLVGMLANDERAIYSAACRCSLREKRQVTRVAFESAATVDKDHPLGQMNMNLAMWFGALRQIEIDGAASASGDSEIAPRAASMRFVRSARAAPRRPSPPRATNGPTRRPTSARARVRVATTATKVQVVPGSAKANTAVGPPGVEPAARTPTADQPPSLAELVSATPTIRTALFEVPKKTSDGVEAGDENSLRTACHVAVPTSAFRPTSKDANGPGWRPTSAALIRNRFSSTLGHASPRRILLQRASKVVQAHAAASRQFTAAKATGAQDRAQLSAPVHEGIYRGCDATLQHPLHEVW
jgi:hypothetical protein